MKPNPLFPSEKTLGINTDLYELAMLGAYFRAGQASDQATFELFTRRLPDRRNYLVSAGLEQALHYVLSLSFDKEITDYLKSLDIFRHLDPAFFEYLCDFRFTGDVYALPEGTPVFPNEPILQVVAPVMEAQLLETYLINTINFQTMVATKAARLCTAADGRQVIDFGSRRAHGPQAGTLAARASFIGGCAGTSNTLAGFELDLPVHGTMAHSFVQFFGDELESFQWFRDTFPQNAVLLVDTYDTLNGVRRALQVEGEISGIRLDSGDLGSLAVEARRLLDQAGKTSVRIVASGDLDEKRLRSLALIDAPIDAYGVGTELVVSRDAPSCDLVYKLVSATRNGETRPRVKLAENKDSMPYRKQIFRKGSSAGFCGDVIARWDEVPAGLGSASVPLLKEHVRKGELIAELPNVFEIRDYAQSQLRALPDSIKELEPCPPYLVEYSADLLSARRELEHQFGSPGGQR